MGSSGGLCCLPWKGEPGTCLSQVCQLSAEPRAQSWDTEDKASAWQGKQVCTQARISEDNLWGALIKVTWQGCRHSAPLARSWQERSTQSQLSVFILPLVHTAFPALGPYLMVSPLSLLANYGAKLPGDPLNCHQQVWGQPHRSQDQGEQRQGRAGRGRLRSAPLKKPPQPPPSRHLSSWPHILRGRLLPDLHLLHPNGFAGVTNTCY